MVKEKPPEHSLPHEPPSQEDGRQEPTAHRLQAQAADVGKRLEQLVAHSVPGVSRKEAIRLLQDGRVQVNGRRGKKGYRVTAGDKIWVWGPIVQGPATDASVAVHVVLARPDLVVVSKETGVPSVAVRPGEQGTLAGALLARYPELEDVGGDPREAGLVHRLDTGTSGLLVAARTPAMHAMLRDAVTRGTLQKQYLAIVPEDGLESTGHFDRPLGPAKRSRRRVRSYEPGCAPQGAHLAETTYRVLARAGAYALVEVSASRAYRHQIRVHFADAGHPLVGDALYGGDTGTSLGDRLALHASRVAFQGSKTILGFLAEQPLPHDLEEFFRHLR